MVPDHNSDVKDCPTWRGLEAAMSELPEDDRTVFRPNNALMTLKGPSPLPASRPHARHAQPHRVLLARVTGALVTHPAEIAAIRAQRPLLPT
jgi:hypothetical protein